MLRVPFIAGGRGHWSAFGHRPRCGGPDVSGRFRCLPLLEFTVRNLASALNLAVISIPALAAPGLNDVDEPSILFLMGAAAVAGLVLRRRK